MAHLFASIHGGRVRWIGHKLLEAAQAVADADTHDALLGELADVTEAVESRMS